MVDSSAIAFVNAASNLSGYNISLRAELVGPLKVTTNGEIQANNRFYLRAHSQKFYWAFIALIDIRGFSQNVHYYF